VKGKPMGMTAILGATGPTGIHLTSMLRRAGRQEMTAYDSGIGQTLDWIAAGQR
jgi:hypothetical protein